MAIKLRKVGDKVMLTPKALKSRPDLRGEVGRIAYRPLSVRGLKDKRDRVMYRVDFGGGRNYGVYATDLVAYRGR